MASASTKNSKKADDPIRAELEAVKRLLMVLLLKAGAKQDEVAWALGVHRTGVSRMLDGQQIKKFKEDKK